MFNKKLIESDAFLEMPLSAQALYFHLAIEADEFDKVCSPKRLLRAVGCSESDLDLLIAKMFALSCADGSLIIRFDMEA